ncbi:MAG: methyltransferase domain-containing protein [Acidobacteria bacterium]|nr:methyltransferase domain-containing protein [Acidobacteriota bacterium]
MTKTQKELAFLRDLYVDDEWTRRFTELVDKHLGFADERRFLYINAGTGNHIIELRRKMGRDAEVCAVCENDDTLTIARDKGTATKSAIDFSRRRFDDESFDAVLADASFVRPENLQSFVDEAARVAEPGGRVAFFTVSAGSFGEVFSLLWEVFFNEDLGEHGAAAERLIAEIPTVSQIEETAARAGLEDVETHVANEIFEYQNGAEFVASPLVADFLLPVWLESLTDKQRARATKKLAELVDAEDGSLTFRFTVKATLVVGEKA